MELAEDPEPEIIGVRQLTLDYVCFLECVMSYSCVGILRFLSFSCNDMVFSCSLLNATCMCVCVCVCMCVP